MLGRLGAKGRRGEERGGVVGLAEFGGAMGSKAHKIIVNV